MKILIIGAGVLGSYLAHVLHCGGNVVTLLARGERKNELLKNGLIIRHSMQLRTTRDKIKITDTFGIDDPYDIVFVVVRRNQLDQLLPQICNNIASKLFVLVGNNPTAKETIQYIQQQSKTQKKILFGFQASGGRRENGKIISIHSGFSTLGGKMTVGSLDGDESFYPILRQTFSRTRYQLEFNPNIDAWLKCHIAFVMPLCFAVYYAHGDLRKIAGNKVFINKIIDSIDEGYQMIQACGIPLEPPSSLEYVREKRGSCYRMLKIFTATPIGKLACSDHAMAAKDEMRYLYDGFCILKNKANLSTPAWNELEQFMETE